MPERLEAVARRRRDPFAGRLLSDRFRLLDRIGSGAMGFVYRARDERDGGMAAVKVLRPELLGDWSLAERFGREARAAQAIESAHVVRILEWGEAGEDVLFIAMELLEGESLAARIARGRVPAAEAVRIARKVTSAIGAAHAAGVIHRDLKPDNVVLGPSGEVKVVDFGIARIIAGSRAASEISAHLTIAGSLMGTPLYMSPEAAARKPVAPPADLYALGVMLYEMISGAPPFVHEDLLRVIGMHLRVRPRRLREACPDLDVPEPLEALVAALLRKDPLERPSAAETEARLDAIAPLLDGGDVVPADTLPDAEAPAEPSAATLIQPRGPDDHDETLRGAPLLEPHGGDRRWISARFVWLAVAGATALLSVVLVTVLSTRDDVLDEAPPPTAHEIALPTPPPARVEPVTGEAARTSEEASRQAAGADRAVGWLTVRADAACIVFVDGVRLGHAPIVRHTLPPGPHEARCVSADGRVARARIGVTAGETSVRRFRLRRREPGPTPRELDIAREYE